MKRKILLILFLCGLVALSVVLEYRARAETSTCSPRGLCIPVQPPDCEKVLRSCTTRVSGWEGSDERTRKFYIPIGALLIAKGMPRSPTDSLFWHFSKIEENIYET